MNTVIQMTRHKTASLLKVRLFMENYLLVWKDDI